MYNVVMLIGRLGQDPELKYFDSGSVKARFTLAVDRTLGQNKQTDWFNIEIWGKQAEIAGEYLKKGKLISLTGQLEVQRWTDQTGNTRETPSIRATEFRMEGSRDDNGGGRGGYTPAGAGMASDAMASF